MHCRYLIALSSFQLEFQFPFLTIALLGYNSHTIKFTCFKYFTGFKKFKAVNLTQSNFCNNLFFKTTKIHNIGVHSPWS